VIPLPLSIPAFDQYQQPLIPLRGLWNAIPKEGDRYIAAEIDWLVTTKSNAVQFNLSGNSPVTLSQIVALAVDNSRSGADCAFVFADSGFQLVVPAHNQLIAPVFTQGLMFYATAASALAGDITTFQVFNSMPPPVPIAPSVAQNRVGVLGQALANGTTQLVPAGINGTLNTLSVSLTFSAAGNCQLALTDGTGANLWANYFTAPAGSTNYPIDLTGLNLRFQNGLKLVVSLLTAAGGIDVNAYYSTP
jgi:hypothetical protein